MLVGVLRNWALGLLLVAVAGAIVMLLHGCRPRWRTGLSLASAAVGAGTLLIGAQFESVQHALFPIRYTSAGTMMGVEVWQPNHAPAWLVALAGYGRTEREWSEERWQDYQDYLDSLPPGTILETEPIQRPGCLPRVAYFDPTYVCGVPGVEPRDPSSTPGVRTYRGVWAFLIYAYGNTNLNALVRGAFFLLGFGIASAAFSACLRKLHPSRPVRAALARIDCASVVCRAAWLSAPFPAVAVLAHAFFYDLMVSTIPASGRTLPLALGRGGVTGIWLGAGLAGALSLYAVGLRAARKGGTPAHFGEASGGVPTCQYAEPRTRRRACGTELAAVTPGLRRWRCGWAYSGLWLIVVLLMCAPLTLPLAGAVIPNWVLPARSPGVPVQAP